LDLHYKIHADSDQVGRSVEGTWRTRGEKQEKNITGETEDLLLLRTGGIKSMTSPL